MADLIDRQELLKHKGNCYDEEGHLLYAVGTGTILLMPTVDAEPVRHGHWIEGNNFHWYSNSCSCCGYTRTTDIKSNGWNQWKYCPNCGAKMDEVEEDADK